MVARSRVAGGGGERRRSEQLVTGNESRANREQRTENGERERERERGDGVGWLGTGNRGQWRSARGRGLAPRTSAYR